MARWTAGALLLAILGCSKQEESDDICGPDSSWNPGGAGETDSFDGASRTYSNGHPLDWHETDSAVIDSELDLIVLINEHRANLGLNTLEFDRSLARCARGHSRHHYEHGLFQGHVNPEGDDFTHRMVNNEIDVEANGENISYGASTAQAVFNGWLLSPPHRSNMEYYCFVRIGVGRNQSVWTANFAR